MHLERLVGRVKGDPLAEPQGMPPTAIYGTPPVNHETPPVKRATPPAKRATRSRKPAARGRGGGGVVDGLTDEEIDARVRIATNQLRKLGAFEDTSAISMSHLTDEQLDRRIRQVEVELEKLKKEASPGEHSGSAKLSRADAVAVVREFEMLDFLIEHPDATISAAAALDAIADEPRRWADLAFGRPSQPQPAQRRGPGDVGI